MTKKDYELIASAFQWDIHFLSPRNKPKYAEQYDLLVNIAKHLAVKLKADNPNFDEDRFLTACGIEIT